MRKKGELLGAPTLVVIIISILILAALALTFTGGWTTLSQKIKDIFGGTTAGTDYALALEQCETYCQQASGMTDTQKANSAFCTKEFHIDSDNDGTADKVDSEYVEFACNGAVHNWGDIGSSLQQDLGVVCPGLTSCGVAGGDEEDGG